MKKADWLTVIFFVLMASVVVWVILKSIGILQSPTLIELYPYLAISFGAGAAYVKLLQIQKTVNKIEGHVPQLEGRMTAMETRCEERHKSR